MNWWNRLFRRGRLEEQLEKELSFHLEQHTADLVARGASLDETRRQARMTLGAGTSERSMPRRTRRTLGGKHSPGWTLCFSNVREEPWDNDCCSAVAGPRDRAQRDAFQCSGSLIPDTCDGSRRLRDLLCQRQFRREKRLGSPSYPEFLDYQARGAGVADFIASSGHGMLLSANGANELISLEMVSENYFRVLGVHAAAGRMLMDSDARFEGAPPAILSYSLWQRKFGGTGDIVGKTSCCGFGRFLWLELYNAIFGNRCNTWSARSYSHLSAGIAHRLREHRGNFAGPRRGI